LRALARGGKRRQVGETLSRNKHNKAARIGAYSRRIATGVAERAVFALAERAKSAGGASGAGIKRA